MAPSRLFSFVVLAARPTIKQTSSSHHGQAASAWLSSGIRTSMHFRACLVVQRTFPNMRVHVVGRQWFHEDTLPPPTIKGDWGNKFDTIPMEDKKAIMAAFDLIDLDENGVIDKEEQGSLEIVLQDAGFKSIDIQRAIKEMDVDGNGEISKDEFVQWWIKHDIHARSKKIRDAVREFYRGDGQLDDKLD